jgi:subfamily B ATP-binding cassette protein HlyB/CyaB
LQCLALQLQFDQFPVEPAQVAHRFAGVDIGASEISRRANGLKLKARVAAETWSGVIWLPLSGIIERRDGSFAILGKATADDVRVGQAGSC